MKKIFLLSMFLIISPCFAIQIDANTKIRWNSAVVNSVLEYSGCFLSGAFGHYIISGEHSLSEIANSCVEYCTFDEDSDSLINLSKESCKQLVENLVAENNKAAELADFVGNTNDQNTCNANPQAIWAKQTQQCIPKNPCMYKQYDKYCDTTLVKFMYSFVPGDNLTSIDIMNIYFEQKGFRCRVSSADVFEDEGSIYVVCNDVDSTKIFQFGKFVQLGEYSAMYSPFIMTDVLCDLFEHKGIQRRDGKKERLREPSLCRTTQDVCHTIYKMVGNKIKVRYVNDVFCVIGDTDLMSKFYSASGLFLPIDDERVPKIEWND